MARIPKVILLIETSRTCERDFLRGIAKYSRLHGPWALYGKPQYYMQPKGGKIRLAELKKSKANGIIISDSDKNRKEIIAMRLPTIIHTVKDQVPNLPNVVGDCTESGRMAAEHLLERGFRNFAYCGLGDFYWSKGRYESFRKRIKKAGFETHFYKQAKSRRRGSWGYERNLKAKWLKSLPKPVGLMTCADDCSQQVIEACKIAGLHVPEQIAVIGVDNDDLVCEISNPPISSVALNFERAGYETAELLDKLMAGKKMANRRIIVQATHIVTRQSTDILAIEDEEVAKAVRFIRQHSKGPIQVSDVADATALSRRVLQQRFHEILGHSVHDEIRSACTEKVARMLIETNLSISQIALALGNTSVKHIARSFRREKGMSPLAYRKQYGKK
ncbi:MAG: XylR family transcriptional regulator [Planctomycetota bacterium]|jgi:LacI family transcriptional regulator